MKVILSEDVASLGKVGDVVTVKDGYARNLLIPKNRAYLATPANLKRIEKLQQKKEKEYSQGKQAAEQKCEEFNKISCTVSVEVNDLDKLYGAVTENEIIQAIEAEGCSVDKKDLVIEKPIEELGIFEVGVKLHPEVTAKIRLWVTKK